MKPRVLIALVILVGTTWHSQLGAENIAQAFAKGGVTGLGARAMGMGGAFVAQADDSSAVYWNPAGLTQLYRPEIHFMGGALMNGKVLNSYLAVLQPFADQMVAGLAAESLRQKAIANNVANLETPGYRSINVKFKELLAKALDSPGPVDLSEIEALIYQPKQTPVKSNGNDVSLEAEVGKMVKNSLLHTTYIRLINNKYRQMELAIDTK